MANVLGEEKKNQVLVLGRLGWPLRRIEEATGVRRETASSYLKAAGIAVRPPRGHSLPAKPASGEEVSTDSGAAAMAKPASGEEVSTDSVGVAMAKPARGEEVSTDSAGTVPVRSPTASACEVHWERIEQAVRLGRNAMAIWQDLVTERGFAHSYASVKRFVGKLRAQVPEEPCAVIETNPGEEAQVDYGTGPMVRDAATGKYRRTRLFVMTLGYSRKAVRLLTFRSSSRIWCQLHETAFRRLGGAVRVVVLDNLREGVLKPDIYDPVLNPLYQDLLAHYGAVALACRVRDPDRKGKVESGIGHTKKTPLKGLRFESLDEAQAYLDRWEERWADTRIHGTTKRQVAAVFAEEKPHLLPLPVEPFRYYQYGTRTVHLDGCVEVARAYYRAVPPARIGQEVGVQWDERQVRILTQDTWTLLREHRVQVPGGYRIAEEEKRRTPKTTEQLLTRAAWAGRHVGAVSAAIHREDGEMGVRRIQGMLALVRRQGRGVVDDACRVALEVGVPSYRFVRRYLEHRPQLHLSLRQVDPLIRELTHYRDLIRQRTGEEEA
jgi:transposase